MGITEDQWVVEEGKSRKNIVSHFTPQKSHIHLYLKKIVQELYNDDSIY